MLAALGAAVPVVTGAGAADASPALGRVVSTARRGIVELNPTTGAVDPVVNAELTGNVSEAAVVNGRLVVSGTFGKKIAALNLATGADTGYLHVPIAGSAVDNPQGHDSPGPGAVSRPGIGAIDAVGGKALAWNPTNDRGVGGRDLLVTARRLWVASDTAHIGHKTRARIALLPVA